jgi:hypothetical protein
MPPGRLSPAAQAEPASGVRYIYLLPTSLFTTPFLLLLLLLRLLILILILSIISIGPIVCPALSLVLSGGLVVISMIIRSAPRTGGRHRHIEGAPKEKIVSS